MWSQQNLCLLLSLRLLCELKFFTTTLSLLSSFELQSGCQLFRDQSTNWRAHWIASLTSLSQWPKALVMFELGVIQWIALWLTNIVNPLTLINDSVSNIQYECYNSIKWHLYDTFQGLLCIVSNPHSHPLWHYIEWEKQVQESYKNCPRKSQTTISLISIISRQKEGEGENKKCLM